MELLNNTPFSNKIANLSLIDNDDTIINKYTPLINKSLNISIHNSHPLNDIYSAIFECGLMNHYRGIIPYSEEHFKFIDDLFFFPLLKVPSGNCVPFDDLESIEMILNRLSHFDTIDISKIITPKQDKFNCWFNTTFMIFFVSDLGRKYSKFFRYFCITGQYGNINTINRALRLSLFYLNIYIDSCLNGSIYSLYINSNYIINRIYETIPFDNFISNDTKAGWPIRYYYSLISKLGLTENESFVPLYEITIGDNNLSSMSDVIKVIFDKTLFLKNNNYILKKENSFYKYPQKINKIPDIIIIDINKKKYPFLNVNDKKKYIKTNYAIYHLDSILIYLLNVNHVCCLITINENYYFYDGSSYSKLIEFDWMKYINSDVDISFSCIVEGKQQQHKINFIKSTQLLVYYKIAFN